MIDEAKRMWGLTPNCGTTSYFFKAKLFDFFEPKGLEKVLEVSGGTGSTTRILSYVFKQVTYVELPFSWDTVAREKTSFTRNTTSIAKNGTMSYKIVFLLIATTIMIM